MSIATVFVQECPTCGRRLHIRVEYLGKKVVCQHCRGRFTAYDPAGNRVEAGSSGESLLRRADELLESASDYVSRCRTSPLTEQPGT
jgi:DNA-directed RNA polymerase subunit RPC12/RpoP